MCTRWRESCRSYCTQRHNFMPILSCCTKRDIYAAFFLLYSYVISFILWIKIDNYVWRIRIMTKMNGIVGSGTNVIVQLNLSLWYNYRRTSLSGNFTNVSLSSSLNSIFYCSLETIDQGSRVPYSIIISNFKSLAGARECFSRSFFLLNYCLRQQLCI